MKERNKRKISKKKERSYCKTKKAKKKRIRGVKVQKPKPT